LKETNLKRQRNVSFKGLFCLEYIRIKEYENYSFGLDDNEEFQMPINLGKYLRLVEQRSKRVTIQALSYIGYIPFYKNKVLVVEPKIAFKDFLRVLLVADENIHTIAEEIIYRIDTSKYNNIFDFMVYCFLEKLMYLAKYGLIRLTCEKYINGPNIKGKILVKENITKNTIRSRNHFVYTRTFDITQNNSVNQVIKYTIWYLLSFNLASEAKDKLLLYYKMMDKISLVLNKNYLKELDNLIKGKTIPDSRSYYNDIISFCKFFLSDYTLNFSGNSYLPLKSFLVDMNKVFEKYIRNALSAKIFLSNSDVLVVDGNYEPKPLFSNLSYYSITPDILLKRQGQVISVMDTKYKPQVKNEDLFQIISYVVSYNVENGVLIYPKSDDAPDLELFEVERKKIYIFRFDLTRLDEEETRLLSFVNSIV